MTTRRNVSSVSSGNVTLRGLEVNNPLSIFKCDASVSVEDCRTRPIDIQDCGRVSIARCVATGGITPQPAVSFIRSHAAIYDSQFTPGPIQPAIYCRQSIVSATNADFMGGNGLRGAPRGSMCYSNALAGGDAVQLLKSTLRMFGGTLRPGAPAAANGACTGRPSGIIYRDLGAGQLVRVQQASRRFQSNAPVREGGILTVEVQGEPGDSALLLVSANHDRATIPGCSGALFPALNTLGIIPMGAIPAGGLRWSVRVQPLPAAAYGGRTAMQALVLPAQGCIFTAPSTLMILDQRF